MALCFDTAHINTPADYWPQKVLAVSSANGAMQNYVSIHEHQTRPNPALIAVQGQAALLLRYDMPTYVSRARPLNRRSSSLVQFLTALSLMKSWPITQEGVDLSAEDFVDKLWLLAITLLLIMVSGENLVERGRLEKTRKPKSDEGKPTEFWSPNFLGRLYQSATSDESETGALTQRPHWRRGYIRSQPHGPRQSLRKIIWVSLYRAGRG
ncbi:MAG: hypothetical protein WB586_22275 [Chthoniobacterales bacterium]